MEDLHFTAWKMSKATLKEIKEAMRTSGELMSHLGEMNRKTVIESIAKHLDASLIWDRIHRNRAMRVTRGITELE